MSVATPKKKISKQIDLYKLVENITTNIGVGVYIVQRRKFVYISPIYSNLTGYSKTDLIGKYSLDHVYPDDRDMVRKQAIKRLKGKSSDAYEYRFIKKNNEVMWVLEMVTSIIYKGKRATLGSFMDITGRKKTEEALRQSEERYRTLLEEIEEGFYEVDLQGNFTFISDVICKTLGYSRKELIGLNFKSYIPEELHEEAYQTWRKVYETGEVIKWYSLVNICKDGRRIDVADSIAPLRNKEGKIIGFRGVTRDVTDRKKMEEAIQRSEEKYRKILKNMQEAYFEVDLAGKLTFVNEAMCENLGFTKEELTGMNFIQFTDKTNSGELYQVYNKIFRTGEPVKTADFEFIRKDGTKLFAESSASIMKDANGKIIGFSGVSRDVTKRRQMEEMIRQSEEKYRTIVDEMDEWYFEIDLSGNLVFVNDAVVRRVDYSLKELIGLNYRAFVKEQQISEVFKIFHQAYETGEPIKNFPYELIRSDESKSFFDVSVFPKIDHDGKVFGFRGIAHDITARKKAEEHLNYMATHDPLTSLPNRMLLMDRLKMAMAQTKRADQKLAVMMLDLDNFKNVNDTLGHMLGDELLKEIALRLTGRLRQNDTISRLGGDEFIILLPAIERTEDAVEVAKTILESFEQPFICNGHTISTSISIGIVIYPDDCQDMDSLLKNADIAMYYVKAHGRNGYHLFTHVNFNHTDQRIQ